MLPRSIPVSLNKKKRCTCVGRLCYWVHSIIIRIADGSSASSLQNVCDQNLADPERLCQASQGLVWGKTIGVSSHTLCGRAIGARNRAHDHHHRQEVTQKEAVLTARCFSEPQTIVSKFFYFYTFPKTHDGRGFRSESCSYQSKILFNSEYKYRSITNFGTAIFLKL